MLTRDLFVVASLLVFY